MAQSGKFGIKKLIKTSGSLGVFDITNDTQISLIIYNAGPSNIIAVYGRIQGQNGYQLIDTVVGSSSKLVEVALFDFIELEVSVYDTIGSYVDIAGSGFAATINSTIATNVVVTNIPAIQDVSITNTPTVLIGNDVTLDNSTLAALESIKVKNNNPSLRFEKISNNIYYMGDAIHGALQSQPVWFIKKIDTTSGIIIKSASASYDQIWDNRASLTYV